MENLSNNNILEQRVKDSIKINDGSESKALFVNAELVGQKIVGLSYLPKKWCPPFAVITTDAYSGWKMGSSASRSEHIRVLSFEVSELVRAWEVAYPRGIILRSSAVSETLNERGMLVSRPLPADFNVDRIGDALSAIFNNAEDELGDEKIAIMIQPLVPGQIGHLSNERRVTKTRNQWMWEQEGASHYSGRFNSQRSPQPEEDRELIVQDDSKLIRCFRSIGRWCTELNKGPVHLEWSWSDGRLWLLQLDFEDESPDDGVDPRILIRDADGMPSEPCAPDGPLKEADTGSFSTGWAKLDKVRKLASARLEPYPRLYWIDGETIRVPQFDRKELEEEIKRVTNGRAVCRTDCNSDLIEKLNLPRTDSVSPKEATDFIYNMLDDFEKRGAKPESVCFIIHKFIPAQAAAWAFADPSSQLVRVDSLWGVPDGLQYLSHDSFEYDVKRNKISSERLRYKPAYIQEKENGNWQEVKIARRFGRFRSLSQPDLADVATVTKAVADSLNKPVQVMWFCGISETVGIGRNLPWFLMEASEYKKPQSDKSSPHRPRVKIRKIEDIDNLFEDERTNMVLVLEPEVNLIRKDDEFLCRIIEFASERNISIEIHGSSLCHAFYLLERSGLTVVPSDEPRYSRTRGRRVFGKMVRDSIPNKIQQHGEQVSLARIGRSESRAALLVKLMEEVQELKIAESPEDVRAELADVHEVIKSLCAATGIEWEDVERIAEEKRAQRGSFHDNVVLLETSWPTGEESAQLEPRLIPLKALAHSETDGQSTQLSYAALFAEGADSTIEISNGMRLKISLNESGIRIEEVVDPSLLKTQFALPFENTE